MLATMKKILLLSLALVLSFTLVGCAGGGGLTQEEIDQIVAGAVSACAEVSTVKFDYTALDMALEIVGGSEEGEINISGGGTAVTDIANREVQAAMSMTMDIAEVGTQEMTTTMYIVDGWMYALTGYTGGEAQWQKTELTEELWQQQGEMESQIEFLQTAAEINYVGSEVVSGTDCYVLEIEAGIEALTELMSQQLASLGIDAGQLDPSDLFKEMSIKQWIAKDTYWVLKAEVIARMEMSADDLGYDESLFKKMLIDMNTGLNFYDYNQPVEIVLPPEALNAEEISY